MKTTMLAVICSMLFTVGCGAGQFDEISSETLAQGTGLTYWEVTDVYRGPGRVLIVTNSETGAKTNFRPETEFEDKIFDKVRKHYVDGHLVTLIVKGTEVVGYGVNYNP